MVNDQNKIEVCDIEERLKALWESDREEKKVRASLFNLIFYSEETVEWDFFRKTINRIIEKFPCRVILISYLKENPDGIAVNVTTEASLRGDTNVVCEEITFTVGGNYILRIPFIISRHLIPDLPIYLFCGHGLLDAKSVFFTLERYASKVLFLCSSISMLSDYSSRILELIKKKEIAASDINWALISGWRELLFRACSSQVTMNIMEQCSKIEIRYNDSGNSIDPIQALFLQGWLAGQLKWEIVDCAISGKNIVLNYQNGGGRSLEVSLSPAQNSEQPSGEILFLHVRSGDCSISFEHHQTSRKVTAHVSTSDKCLLPFTLPLPNLQKGFNFIKEIFYEGAGDHYTNMLKVLAKTPWNNNARK